MSFVIPKALARPLNTSVDKLIAWITRYLSMACAAIAAVLTLTLWVAGESTDRAAAVRVQPAGRHVDVATLPDGVRDEIDATRGVSTVGWFVLQIDPARLPPGSARAMLFEQGLNRIESLWLLEPAATGDALAASPVTLRESGPIDVADVPSTKGRALTWLARYRSPGIGMPKVRVAAVDDLPRIERRTATHASMYATTFLVLATFSGVVAIAAMEPTFLLLAAWLLTTLRVLAVNEGWGLQWINATLSPEGQAILMPTTLALHGIFTVALFRALLGHRRVPALPDRLLQLTQVAFCLLAPLALVLPFSLTYRLFWGCSICAVGVSLPTSFWVAWRHRDAVAASISAAWVFVLLGLGREILYSLGVVASPSPWLNAGVASVSGAALCALSLAFRLREESTGRMRASRARRLAEDELRRSYDEIPIGLFTCDRTGELIRFNRAFSALYERLRGVPAERQSTTLDELLGGEQVRAILASSLSAESAVISTRTHDDVATLTLSIRARARDAWIECSVEDITERIEAESALARMNDHDALTEALNLRGLHMALDLALARARLQVRCGLVVVDIDRFKIVNELFGYTTADSLLLQAMERIRPLLGPGDAVARVSDAFYLVCIDRDDGSLDALAQRVLVALSDMPFQVNGRDHGMTASIGVVDLDGSMEPRDAIAAATQACDAAKSRGRNRVSRNAVHDRALVGYLEDLRVQADLQLHLSEQRFFLMFQPIVSLASPFECLNYEVLVRMRSQDGHLIDPSRFIPAAERNGQMPYIDRWVVLQTLGFLRDNPAHVRHLDYVTINLSGGSLNDPRFADDLFGLLSRHADLNPKLCFEITETVAIADRSATRAFTDRVRALGCRVALDDFGAGFTSIGGLRDLGVDVIKIDGSFIRDMHVNAHNLSITRMLSNLAHELGMRCVGEWAESEAVIQILRDVGVDYAQGFALSRPLDPSLVLNARCSGDLVADVAMRSLLRAPPRHAGERAAH